MALSQLIVTSRYLKSGSQKNKNKRRNYTKYIATRETVEVRDQNTIDRNDNATKNQNQLLNDLLLDFPEAKKYLEYEDYTTAPTVENASELISTIIERNADVIGNRQNFVGYIAMRPGVQKRGMHGLFNESDEPIILDKAANEIANHNGRVWSHVVSLRREDAIRLGYDNSEVWRELVKRHIADIAKAQRIPICNLKWYGAFHDTAHHPHIHLLVYSTNPSQGFLTKEGIDKIRSVFANDIFHDELHTIYMEQTISRDEIKAVSKSEFESIIKRINQNGYGNPDLENYIRKLHSQLQNVRGKKVYGYLPREVKETVNNIFSELAKDKNIQLLYEKWCGLERLKHKIYTQKEKELPELTENKVFQPVRNMIIRTVLGMGDFVWDTEESKQVESEEFTAGDFSRDYENTAGGTGKTPQSSCYLKWSDNYKQACKLIYDKKSRLEDFQKAKQLLLSESQAGNVLADYDLGKLYDTEKLGTKDEEKSQKYYFRALKGFLEIEPAAEKLKPYLQYRIGKMHCYGLGTKQDYTQAFDWFLKSSEQGNRFAQFSLANLYYYGSGVEKNLSQAFMWYMKSAAQGQPYAAYSVAQMYSKGEYVAEDKEMAQRYYKSALSGFLELERTEQADDNLFYKIGMMYKNGLGTDVDVTKSIDYFQRSAENKWSTYQLGKLYLFGAERVEKDKSKAAAWLSKSADDGNEYAGQLLDNVDKFENIMLANAVIGLFANLSRCIEEDYLHKRKAVGLMVDRKLRRVIMQKKQSLGIKEEPSQSYEQSY